MPRFKKNITGEQLILLSLDELVQTGRNVSHKNTNHVHGIFAAGPYLPGKIQHEVFCFKYSRGKSYITKALSKSLKAMTKSDDKKQTNPSFVFPLYRVCI